MAFGLRKALQTECGKANMDVRIQQVIFFVYKYFFVILFLYEPSSKDFQYIGHKLQLEAELKELDRQVVEWKVCMQ